MAAQSAPWSNTTHDWAATVDRDHLDAIRQLPGRYTPGGLRHLVLEVLAYANDEAEALGRRGQALVTVHADGSVSVADDGRGTDTRRDTEGQVIGAWTQRYEHGLPTTDLLPIDSPSETGTTVHFLADHDLLPAMEISSAELARDAQSFAWLSVVAQVA